MEQKWTEFSGVAGRVLQKSVSGSSLITGLALGFVLFVGDWVLIMANTPGATVPFNQIVLALALARFAVNGLYGEWSGTVFSGSGGPWSMVSMVAFRYIVLTAIWLIPMMLLGPRPEQAAMMGPAMMSGKFVAFGLTYMLAMTLTPPLFLIVALGADNFTEVFSPDHWRRLFSGRMGDLFAIYVVYTGTLGMVLVLAIAPVVLAFSANMKLGFLVGGITFCLLFGMSVNLLGRLCGFFTYGELGLTRPSDPVLASPTAPQEPAAPMAAPQSSHPMSSPPAVAAVPVAAAPVVASVPVSGAEPGATPFGSAPAAPAVPTAAAVPGAAAAAPGGEKKPPLPESKERIEAELKRYPQDPAGAISALRDMNDSYAAHPHVKEAYAVCLHRSGNVDEAIAVANEALPLCFERGHSYLAAEIFREMRAELPRLKLGREQILTIAGALSKMDDLSGAAKAYSTVIAADSGESRAVKGLLQVAERIAAEKSNPAAAAKVYRYLLQHCSASPLVEYMRQGLEDAERKLGRVTA